MFHAVAKAVHEAADAPGGVDVADAEAAARPRLVRIAAVARLDVAAHPSRAKLALYCGFSSITSKLCSGGSCAVPDKKYHTSCT